jgi:hypothetical protein
MRLVGEKGYGARYTLAADVRKNLNLLFLKRANGDR